MIKVIIENLNFCISKKAEFFKDDINQAGVDAVFLHNCNLFEVKKTLGNINQEKTKSQFETSMSRHNIKNPIFKIGFKKDAAENTKALHSYKKYMSLHGFKDRIDAAISLERKIFRDDFKINVHFIRENTLIF